MTELSSECAYTVDSHCADTKQRRTTYHRLPTTDAAAQYTEPTALVTPRHDPPEPTNAEERGEPSGAATDPRSAVAYRLGFQRYAPVAWDVIERAQGDLLRLLVGKLPADLGVPAILGANVLFETHPKAEQASFSFLATGMNELDPRRARTLFATLADSWKAAARLPLERRAELMRRDVLRTVARLEVGDLPASERQGLAFLRDLLDVAGGDPERVE